MREPGLQFFLFTLFAYQYLLLASVIKDIRLGPANLQVTLATILFVVCAIIRRERVIQLLGWQVVTVLGLGLVFIPFKMVAGYLRPQGLQAMRLFFILPLLWAVYAAYVDDEEIRRKVASIIIWNCAFIALFGLVHFFFFPTVVLAVQTEAYKAGNISLIPGHSQEPAFFGNPSGYGAILVTALLAIYMTKRRSPLYTMLFLFITLATYVSISRTAVLFATILLVLYFVSGVSLRRRKGLVPIVALVVAGMYVVSRIPFFWLALQAVAARWGVLHVSDASFIAIADQVGGGRLVKYTVGLQIAFRDFSHMLLGIRDGEELVVGDHNFSDNSFIFLALGFGVPLTILWIVTVLRRAVPPRVPRDVIHAFLLVFIYGSLITTPALGWDMWLVYVLALLFISDHCRPRARVQPPRPVPQPATGPAGAG